MHMTVKELATTVALFASAVTGGGTVVGFVHNYYMDQIRASELRATIFHYEDKIVELNGTKALYEARAEVDGQLSLADNNRYQTILRKIDASEEALALLRQDLVEVR